MKSDVYEFTLSLLLWSRNGVFFSFVLLHVTAALVAVISSRAYTSPGCSQFICRKACLVSLFRLSMQISFFQGRLAA
jgi:hypothetical protein